MRSIIRVLLLEQLALRIVYVDSGNVGRVRWVFRARESMRWCCLLPRRTSAGRPVFTAATEPPEQPAMSRTYTYYPNEWLRLSLGVQPSRLLDGL